MAAAAAATAGGGCSPGGTCAGVQEAHGATEVPAEPGKHWYWVLGSLLPSDAGDVGGPCPGYLWFLVLWDTPV